MFPGIGIGIATTIAQQERAHPGTLKAVGDYQKEQKEKAEMQKWLLIGGAALLLIVLVSRK